MDFALSPEQFMLQESVTGFLKQAAPLDTIRIIAAGDDAAAMALDAGLAKLGLTGLLVPEAKGGAGLGLLDACLVQELLGYHLVNSAFTGDCIAARAMSHAKASQAALPHLASGEWKAGFALSDHFSDRGAGSAPDARDRLIGRTVMALAVPAMTHVLLRDERGMVRMAELASGESILMQTIDRTRRFLEIKWTKAKPVVRSGEGLPAALQTACLLIAADTLGAAQAMLDKAVAYAQERKQFGRTIGSFQAVKHLCADMAAKLEPCRALIWHAAHALDTGDMEGEAMAYLAKSHLAEVGTFVARTSTEVHGGMGFTDLAGLHYWFKRIGVNRQLIGSPEQMREMAARVQGLTVV